MDDLIKAFILQQTPLFANDLQPDVKKAVNILVSAGYLGDANDRFERTESGDAWLDAFYKELDKEFEGEE